MMCLGESGIAFELGDELIVGVRLLPREINVEHEQWNQAHDGNVIGGRANLPKLSPVHKVSKTLQTSRSDSSLGRREGGTRPFSGLIETPDSPRAVPTRAYSPAAFGPLLGLSASSVSITGAGPEIPPSFLTRQK